MGYLRSPYQRGGMFPYTYDRDPTRFWGKQLGGALYRRRPTLTDKIAEGVAMGLSGPSPSFLKLGAFLGKQAVKGMPSAVSRQPSKASRQPS